MIIVITEGTDGQRHEISGVVEGMINMLVARSQRIAQIGEGRVEFALWPGDVVEMFLVELVAESIPRRAR